MSSKQNTLIQTKPCYLAVAIALTLLATAPVQAQNSDIRKELTGAQEVRTWLLNIPAQPLPQALADLSAVTGLQVLYTEEATFDHTAPALSGSYSLHDALQRLLSGSGLMIRITGENSVTLQKASNPDSGTMTLGLISVEGYIDDGFANPYADEQKRLNTLRPDLILGGDQMQRFPDEHIGKALDRLPGMFSTSPSEKQEVRVRGLDKQFTRVEVDGVTIQVQGDGETCLSEQWQAVWLTKCV
ncbi:hypothetical protein LH51_13265 [Nitrincola sp. A-D6]|uniref:STN domain-containing protein n=1 Tax=Nitrincola sp. A-D6 TaxID=1545442 RepID=UPI00051FD5DD|nr:STN domain-containing protein [Nitrincola sp. A-D6]KGK41652.1 hypothetical protein LH51_13265 [Nitrincola sp. A-D6]